MQEYARQPLHQDQASALWPKGWDGQATLKHQDPL